MLTKSKVKLFVALRQKRYRDELNLFVAEGEKLVCDLAKSLRCICLVADSIFIDKTDIRAEETIVIEKHSELKKITSLATPSSVIALFEKPAEISMSDIELHKNIVLALDSIQDTGNMGTILRIADWFGIEHIVCSKTNVDIYNAKTVQSSMGAIANVKVLYYDLPLFFYEIKKYDIPIYGAFLEGDSIYNQKFTNNGIIVLGNEGKGISPQIEQYVNNRITIPHFSNNPHHSESLNVAIATAIICSEFRNRL